MDNLIIAAKERKILQGNVSALGALIFVPLSLVQQGPQWGKRRKKSQIPHLLPTYVLKKSQKLNLLHLRRNCGIFHDHEGNFEIHFSQCHPRLLVLAKPAEQCTN